MQGPFQRLREHAWLCLIQRIESSGVQPFLVFYFSTEYKSKYIAFVYNSLASNPGSFPVTSLFLGILAQCSGYSLDAAWVRRGLSVSSKAVIQFIPGDSMVCFVCLDWFSCGDILKIDIWCLIPQAVNSRAANWQVGNLSTSWFLPLLPPLSPISGPGSRG